MFKSDQNRIHVNVMGLYAALRSYRDIGSVSRRWIYSGSLLSHSPHASFSQTQAHKPGRTPGQGLQIKGMSKGRKVTVQEQRGGEKRAPTRSENNMRAQIDRESV